MIENYIGFKIVQGLELVQNMYDGVIQFGVIYGYGMVMVLIVNEDGIKSVMIDMGDIFIVKVVVIVIGFD